MYFYMWLYCFLQVFGSSNYAYIGKKGRRFGNVPN